MDDEARIQAAIAMTQLSTTSALKKPSPLPRKLNSLTPRGNVTNEDFVRSIALRQDSSTPSTGTELEVETKDSGVQRTVSADYSKEIPDCNFNSEVCNISRTDCRMPRSSPDSSPLEMEEIPWKQLQVRLSTYANRVHRKRVRGTSSSVNFYRPREYLKSEKRKRLKAVRRRIEQGFKVSVAINCPTGELSSNEDFVRSSHEVTHADVRLPEPGFSNETTFTIASKEFCGASRKKKELRAKNLITVHASRRPLLRNTRRPPNVFKSKLTSTKKHKKTRDKPETATRETSPCPVTKVLANESSSSKSVPFESSGGIPVPVFQFNSFINLTTEIMKPLLVCKSSSVSTVSCMSHMNSKSHDGFSSSNIQPASATHTYTNDSSDVSQTVGMCPAIYQPKHIICERECLPCFILGTPNEVFDPKNHPSSTGLFFGQPNRKYRKELNAKTEISQKIETDNQKKLYVQLPLDNWNVSNLQQSDESGNDDGKEVIDGCQTSLSYAGLQTLREIGPNFGLIIPVFRNFSNSHCCRENLPPIYTVSSLPIALENVNLAFETQQSETAQALKPTNFCRDGTEKLALHNDSLTRPCYYSSEDSCFKDEERRNSHNTSGTAFKDGIPLSPNVITNTVPLPKYPIDVKSTAEKDRRIANLNKQEYDSTFTISVDMKSEPVAVLSDYSSDKKPPRIGNDSTKKEQSDWTGNSSRNNLQDLVEVQKINCRFPLKMRKYLNLNPEENISESKNIFKTLKDYKDKDRATCSSCDQPLFPQKESNPGVPIIAAIPQSTYEVVASEVPPIELKSEVSEEQCRFLGKTEKGEPFFLNGSAAYVSEASLSTMSLSTMSLSTMSLSTMSLSTMSLSQASSVSSVSVSSNRNEIHSAIEPDEDGDLPIHVAVVQGRVDVVDSLISVMSQLRANIDSVNRNRQTPLHLAVITNQSAIVRKLLLAGASPNVSDRKGHNSIHLAVNERSVECLRIILLESKAKIDVNTMNYEGLTALHLAVLQGNFDSVEMLLSAGAQVNEVDGKNGRTCIYYAAETGNLAMAELLLKLGASPYIASYSGCLPVSAARSNAAMVKLFESHSTELAASVPTTGSSDMPKRKRKCKIDDWKKSNKSTVGD